MPPTAIHAIESDLNWFISSWVRASSTTFLDADSLGRFLHLLSDESPHLPTLKQAVRQSPACQQLISGLSRTRAASTDAQTRTRLAYEICIASAFELCFQTIQASRLTCFHTLASDEASRTRETLHSTASFEDRLTDYGLISDTLSGIAGVLDDIHRILNRVDSLTVPLGTTDHWVDTLHSAVTADDSEEAIRIIDELIRCTMGRWTTDDFFQYSGTDFEKLVAHLFDSLGFNARATRGSGDYGVDVVVKTDSYRGIGQVKRCSDSLGLKTVRGYLSLPTVFDADELLIISASELTGPARKYCRESSIPTRIIAGDQLVRLFSNSSLHPPSDDTPT